MKINGKKPGGVRTCSSAKRPGDLRRRKKICQCGKAAESDKMDSSSKDNNLLHIKNFLDSVPDIRSEMVIRLKAEVESGSYYVDAGKVAEKMIERALRNVINTKKV
jgi:negative regulator of flagellin synthesis FlgM